MKKFCASEEIRQQRQFGSPQRFPVQEETVSAAASAL